MIYIGIDPGDRWQGFAMLEVAQAQCNAYTAVYDRNVRSLSELIDLLIPVGHDVTVAIEEYRIRPQGFNRFASIDTPKLIGALEYRTLCLLDSRVIFVAAANPIELNEFPVADVVNFALNNAIKHSPQWDHARSAWRVLATCLMKTNVQLLMTIRKPYRLQRPPKIRRIGLDDLIAPIVSWSRT